MRPEADQALRRLNALDGFFRNVITQRAPARRTRMAGAVLSRSSSGRSRMSLGGGYSDERTLIEVSLVRVVTVLEAFVMDLGTEVVSERLLESSESSDLHHLASYLVDGSWGKISEKGGWDAAIGFWKEGLGTNLAKFDFWSQVRDLRTTRHAIVHRLGDITENYRSSETARRRFEALGLSPKQATGLIPLTKDDVPRAVELSRKFIRWADEKVPQ